MSFRNAYGRAIKWDTSWFNVYRSLSNKHRHSILLESGRGGRYSIMGLTPFAELVGKDGVLTVTETDTKQYEGPLLQSLRNWLSYYEVTRSDSLPEFCGGVIGQFSYDLVREIEKLPTIAKDDLETADLHLFAYDQLYVYDHQTSELWFIAIADSFQRADQMMEELETAWVRSSQDTSEWDKSTTHVSPKEGRKEASRSFSEKTFTRAVEKVKSYIESGDVFQVNLSVRESRELYTEPMHVYECLRELNPSPYMGYMETPEIQYVSASPELLVKVKGREVSTRPIAGTRSRGRDDAEDQRLADTLLKNEKERAEHIMLVDLERNDLGRVCSYGSVKVDELMVIEKYSHVMHIVSNVIGTKAEGIDALDVLAATFPGGTITGAPKIRTMEIIEELEPVRRGAYTGSMGWIGFDGDMEVNITIRTMIVKDGMAHVQAGAGIVIDSNPRAEYLESLKKAKALWRAKEMSEEEKEHRRVRS